MSTPLSIIILTYNEADVLAPTMQAAASIADELMVVDSFSQDNTVCIAKEHGATRIEKRTFKNWADQRNWAMEQSQHPWVLFIDADEVLDKQLISSLHQWKSVIHTDKEKYWGLRRIHFFMNHAMRFSGLQSDVVVRLFHHTRRYSDCEVHEKINVPKPHPLQGILQHYTYKNWEEWNRKQRIYASRSALDHQAKTGTVGLFHFAIKPAFRFFKHFVLRLGFLDGHAGFWYSISMAQGVYWRYVELKKLRLS